MMHINLKPGGTRGLQAECGSRRRAATAVMVAVTLPVLIGFAALTLDVATIHSVRAELQASADAAAMAAASAYVTDPMLQIRLGYGGNSELYDTKATGITEVNRVAAMNHSFGLDATAIASDDVRFGWIDLTSGTSPLNTGVANDQFNAVEVVTRRDDDVNGAVSLFFAPVFGKNSSNVSARAVAVLDDRFQGYDVGDGTAELWPMTLSETAYQQELVNGSDSWNLGANGEPSSGGDGVREINIYPHVSVPGNFGLLNIGLGSNSASAVGDQLKDGVTPEQIEDEIGSTVVHYYDDGGNSITHDIDGTPGLKASLESSMDPRVGDVVAFLLHDQATSSGSNAIYRTTAIVFARLMEVKLQGSSSSRGVWLQPVAYTGAGVVTNANAPSSNGTVGTVMLAR